MNTDLKEGDVVAFANEYYTTEMLIPKEMKMTIASFTKHGNVKVIYMDDTGIVYTAQIPMKKLKKIS